MIDTPPAKGTLSAGTGAVPHLHGGRRRGRRLLHLARPQPDAWATARRRPRTITITHDGQPDPDLPADVSPTAKPGRQRTITPPCTDADADALAFAKDSDPAHGTLDERTAASCATRRPPGYIGPDSFTYRATDGLGGQSAVSTGVDHRLQREHRAHVRDRPVPLQVDGRRPARPSRRAVLAIADGDTLTIEVPTGPSHGTLTAIRGRHRTYTPNAGYTGPDSFTFRAFDGTARSAIGHGEHHRPAARERGAGLPAGHASASRPARRRLGRACPARTPTATRSRSRRSGPAVARHARRDRPGHRQRRLHARRRATPARDSFTYRATDGTRHRRGGDRVAHGDARAGLQRGVAHDAGRHGRGGAAELHGRRRGRADAVDRLAAGARHARARSRPGSVTYTPAAGYFGADSFTYRATDGTAQSRARDGVDHGDARPVLPGRPGRARPSGTAKEITFDCTDPDGDALTFSKVTDPAHGTLGGDRGRQGHLHAGSGLQGRRLVHLPGERRHGAVHAPPRSRSPSPTAAPDCNAVSRSDRRGGATSRSR